MPGWLSALPSTWRLTIRYLAVPLAVALLTVSIVPARDRISVFNALFLYLMLCYALALTAGSGPAVLAALLSFGIFNYFFVPPIHTFRIADSDHAVALIAFLGVAIVTGQLVARVRTRTEVARREQHRTALLYELNAALIGNVTLDAMLATIVERLVRIYGAASCRILRPAEGGALAVSAGFPPPVSPEIERQRSALARRAMDQGAVMGRSRTSRRVVPARGDQPGAGLMADSEFDSMYVPIRTASRTLGVLEVNGRPGGGRFSAEDEQLLATFANQAALAVERASLLEAAARAGALAESDAFKSTLLAALSHDLRTPLAVIKASSSALLDPTVTWDETARSGLLVAIDEEADRLDRPVGNLLDLTRLQGTVLRPNREWYDIAELIADVIQRPPMNQSGHPIEIAIEGDLPSICFDYVQIAQVLTNLIENAIKYTPAGTSITVSARRVVGMIEIAVADTGPGIAPTDVPHLFDPFYRGGTDRRIPGTGIGLAICRGFVEAHGGQIRVRSQVGEGTVFSFTLPIDRQEDGVRAE